jgi:type II secretory pathway component PulJ
MLVNRRPADLNEYLDLSSGPSSRPLKRSTVRAYLGAHRHEGWSDFQFQPSGVDNPNNASSENLGRSFVPALSEQIALSIRGSHEQLELRSRVATLERELRASSSRARDLLGALPAITSSDALSRLALVAQLDDDWDGSASKAPTARAIDAAYRLLIHSAERLYPSLGESSLPWTLAPLSGGLQLEWRALGRAVEVEITADGQLEFLIEVDGVDGKSYDEGSVTSIEDLITVLLSALVPNAE